MGDIYSPEVTVKLKIHDISEFLDLRYGDSFGGEEIGLEIMDLLGVNVEVVSVTLGDWTHVFDGKLNGERYDNN